MFYNIEKEKISLDDVDNWKMIVMSTKRIYELYGSTNYNFDLIAKHVIKTALKSITGKCFVYRTNNINFEPQGQCICFCFENKDEALKFKLAWL